MQTRINIQDATQFRLQEQKSLKVGQLFVRDGILNIRSAANGHILDTTLSGDAPFISREPRRNHRVVAVLDNDLRLACRALGSIKEFPEAPAGMAVLLDGGLAVCVSFVEDAANGQESGRVAVIVGSGKIEFHGGGLPFCLPEWELTWLDANGGSVLTITTDDSN